MEGGFETKRITEPRRLRYGMEEGVEMTGGEGVRAW